MKQKIATFIFTHGKQYGGGWTEVTSLGINDALEKYCAKFPADSYCSVYSEDEFKKTRMFKDGNFGRRCVCKLV